MKYSARKYSAMTHFSPVAMALAFALRAGGGECQAVEGHITGRDLAVAVPAFGALEPGIDIAPAPLAGVERVFHAEDLTRIAREHGLALPGPPSAICFLRKTRVLTAGLLLPALEQSWGSLARIEILDFARFPVPAGEIEFPRNTLAATGLWRGRVVASEGRTTPIWVRVRVTDPVTGVPMPIGPSAEARDVNRGDAVRVEVQNGRAVIAFDSIAESSGRRGEMVLVSNPAKSRRLLARVEDTGKVSIKK